MTPDTDFIPHPVHCFHIDGRPYGICCHCGWRGKAVETLGQPPDGHGRFSPQRMPSSLAWEPFTAAEMYAYLQKYARGASLPTPCEPKPKDHSSRA